VFSRFLGRTDMTAEEFVYNIIIYRWCYNMYDGEFFASPEVREKPRGARHCRLWSGTIVHWRRVLALRCRLTMVEKKIITVRTRTHTDTHTHTHRCSEGNAATWRGNSFGASCNVTDFREENTTGGYVFFSRVREYILYLRVHTSRTRAPIRDVNTVWYYTLRD